MKLILTLFVLLLTTTSNAGDFENCEGSFLWYSLPDLRELPDNQINSFCSMVKNKTCKVKSNLMEHYHSEGYAYYKGICDREINYIKALENFIKAITDVGNQNFKWGREDAIRNLFSYVKNEIHDNGEKLYEGGGVCATIENRLLNKMYDIYEVALLKILEDPGFPDWGRFNMFRKLMWDYEGDWNYGRSLSWLEKTAARGWPEAAFKLGMSYRDGLYDSMDPTRVNNLNNKWCGRIHGHYVLKDPVEAYKWFNIGAFLGDSNAAFFRDGMEEYDYINQQGVLEANALAKEFIKNQLKN